MTHFKHTIIIQLIIIGQCLCNTHINKFDDPLMTPGSIEIYKRFEVRTINPNKCTIGIKLKSENNPMYECTNLCGSQNNSPITCDDGGCGFGSFKILGTNGFSFDHQSIKFYKNGSPTTPNCYGEEINKIIDPFKHPFMCENGEMEDGFCTVLARGGNGENTLEYTEREFTSFEITNVQSSKDTTSIEKSVSMGLPIKIKSFNANVDASMKRNMEKSFESAVTSKTTNIFEKTAKVTTKCMAGSSAYIFVHYRCVKFEYSNCKNELGGMLGQGQFKMCRGVPTTNCGDRYENCDLKLAKNDPAVKRKMDRNKPDTKRRNNRGVMIA